MPDQIPDFFIPDKKEGEIPDFFIKEEPKKQSIIDQATDFIQNFPTNHPTLNRIISGPPESEWMPPDLAAHGGHLVGPGITKWPGVEKGFDWLANKIDPKSGVGGALQGGIAGGLQGIGNLIAGLGADPRTIIPGLPESAPLKPLEAISEVPPLKPIAAPVEIPPEKPIELAKPKPNEAIPELQSKPKPKYIVKDGKFVLSEPEKSIESDRTLATTNKPSNKPYLAGVTNSGNGIVYIQFDKRLGSDVTSQMVKDMFPDHQFEISKFKANPIRPDIQRFRLDMERYSPKAADDLVNSIGGEFRDWNSPLKPDNSSKLESTEPEQGKLEEFLKSEEGSLNLEKIIDYFKSKFMNSEKPIELEQPIEEPTDPVIAKLTEAIKVAKPIREMQESLYSKERGERIAAVESVKEPGLGGYYKQLGKLKGELPKLQLDQFKLNDQEVDSLIDHISSGNITSFEKIRAKAGLVKLLTGEVPQRSELELLSRTMGPDFANTVMMHGGMLGPLPFRVLNETSNFMKSMMASIDLSAPLRQGLPLIHKKEFWNSFVSMFGQAASESKFQGLMQSLEDRPNYILGRDSGLKLTDLNAITNREELYLSKLAEKVPLVRASERGYTGFINKLRADTFDSLYQQAKKMGHDVGDGTNSTDVTRSIAKFVNTATGRGSLGGFEKIAPELNSLFFSPRLVASRLTMLNPNYYVNLDPIVRKEALKSLFAVAGAGLTIAGISHLFGATVSDDPSSADFGKAKFGQTRLDPYGGFQQYIVAADRMITGKSEGKELSRWDVAENFGLNKLSPMAGLIYTLMNVKPDKLGNLKNKYGETVSVPAEIGKRFVMMIMQDMYDIYQSDPDLLPLGIAGAFGAGLQTYPDKKLANNFRLRLQ